MKTIIIDLPPNVNPTGAAYAIATVANEIGCGAIAVTPPFHYNIDTSVGPVTVRSEPDNQAHPPLNTPLSAFTPAMLDALPVGSAFGPGEEISGVVVKDDRGWRPAAGDRYAPDFGAPGWDLTRPLIRVGPEPKPTLASFAPEDIDKVCAEHRAYPTHEIVSKMRREWRESADVRRVGPEQASEPAPSATLPDPWAPCHPRAVAHDARTEAATEPALLPDPWPNMLVEVQADSADEWDRGAIRRAYRARHGTLYVHVEGLENPVQWHPDEIREVRTPDGATVWKRPAAKVTT